VWSRSSATGRRSTARWAPGATSPAADFTPGKFITPHAAIFLASGDILVAEWLPIGRLTLLRKV
jgi:hypothetical protein